MKTEFKKFYNNNKGWLKILATLFGIALIIFIWWIISICVNDYVVLPGPTQTFVAFGDLLSHEDIYIGLGYTLARLLMGFVYSFICAFILGIIAGLCPLIKHILNPLIIVLRTVPTAAVVYLLIVLVATNQAIDLIEFLIMFPIMYEAVCGGIESIDSNIKNSLRLELPLYHPKALIKVLIPCSSHFILIGVIQTIGLGMKVGIMAEILVGTSDVKGLGKMINLASNYLMMDYVIAISMVAILFIGFFDLLLRHIKKRIK